MRKPAACFTCLLMLCSTVYAQYASDFEALNASAAGVVLTGQDGYYIPGGTDSVDYLAYTYAGNALGIPQNPGGGEQFIAGVGPGSPTFARAQRDINWGMGTTTWTHSYDVLVIQTEGDPGSNNIGSYSLQPFGDRADYIHLFSWSDTPLWQALYLAYNADGSFMNQPGFSPGPEWENLQLNRWYRFTTDIHFGQNRITKVTLTDLETGECTEADLTDLGVYLGGGSNGGLPMPTGFRFFAGGGVPGNTVAWDNTEVRRGFAGAVCDDCDVCDMDCDGDVDAFDIEPFLALLFDENLPPCCGTRGSPPFTGDTDGDGDIDAFDIEPFLACLFP